MFPFFQRGPRHSWDEAFALWRTSLGTQLVPRSAQIATILTPWRASKSLAAVRRDDLLALATVVRDDPETKAKDTTLLMLRKFFLFALAHGWLASSLTEGDIRSALHGVPRSAHAAPPLPDRETWKVWRTKLVEAASHTRYASLQARVVMWLLVWRGMRTSEFAAVRAGDLIQQQQQWWLIVRGAHARRMLLPDQLVVLIQQFGPSDPQQPLFVDRLGDPVNARSVRALLTSCCRRANIPIMTARTVRSVYARYGQTHRDAV